MAGQMYSSVSANTWIPMNGIMPAKIWFKVTCGGLKVGAARTDPPVFAGGCMPSRLRHGVTLMCIAPNLVPITC